MSAHYSDTSRENDPHALPDVEVFEAPQARACEGCNMLDLDGMATECECGDNDAGVFSWEERIGWYWWPCFPGCIPDSDPCGPFATEADALADAQDGTAEGPYGEPWPHTPQEDLDGGMDTQRGSE